MSEVINKFDEDSGIYIECRHSTESEPRPLIPPGGGKEPDLPQVGGYFKFLILKAIESDTLQHSDIKSIAWDNSRYKPIPKYDYYFRIWRIGAKKRRNWRRGIDPLQTNVNVEIGPKYSIIGLTIGFLGRFINLLFRR